MIFVKGPILIDSIYQG